MTASKPMGERLRRPDWVTRLNLMAESVGGEPRALVPLDPDDLVAEASKRIHPIPTHDLGDPLWRARFETLSIGLDRSNMHLLGRLMTKQELLRGLRTRLLLSREFELHPEIGEQRIESPLIVTGPARSGTSILFELLSLDPELRAPTAADALHPLPLPEDDALSSKRSLAECEQEFWADVQPEFAAIHELRSDLPVECVTLTLPSFCGSHWAMITQLPGWVPDFAANYEFERRILQVMQHGRPRGRWLLKTPGHLMTLELLFAAFPDAWVVQTHRDPARSMPSTVSTTAMVQWLRTDHVDVPLLSTAIEAVFTGALNRTVELRSTGAVPERFVDVHFRQLMQDPVETLRVAYARMQRELSRDHAEAIRAYLAAKPPGKFGTHRYSPEEWGFDVDALRKQMAPYIEHFGVELE